MNLHLYIYYQSTLWNRLQSRFSLLAVPWHVLVFFLTWQLHFKKHLRASTINTWWSHACTSQGATRDKAVMFFFLYRDYYKRIFFMTSLDVLYCELKGSFSGFLLTFEVLCTSYFFCMKVTLWLASLFTSLFLKYLQRYYLWEHITTI